MAILKNLLLSLWRGGASSPRKPSVDAPGSADLESTLDEMPPERLRPEATYTLDSMPAEDRDALKQELHAKGRALPPEQDMERVTIAHAIRFGFRDDYLASQTMLHDDAGTCGGPLRVRLESASACNLRCQHCPTGVNYHATDRSVMKPELFDRVIGQMKELPTLRSCVLYLGGEPLMNKHLVQMCRRVKEETTVVRTLITTNAMLLDEKACAGLATAMLDDILVSVDGRSPEENDAIRLRAKYSTIVENVACLRRHLEGTITRVAISHSMFRRPQDPDQPQAPEFLKRDFPGLPIWTDYATRWPGFEIEKCAIPDTALKVQEHRNFCDFPFFEMAVRANGDVTLCCHDLLGEGVMGNVYRSDLRRIWNDAPYRELRRGMLARDENAVHAVCRKCFIFTGERIVRDSPDLAVV